MGLVTHEETPPSPSFHTFWLYLFIKGQIVIPAELREKCAIAPGETVDVRDGDGKILIFHYSRVLFTRVGGFSGEGPL